MLVRRGSSPCPLFVPNLQLPPGSPSSWVSPPEQSGPLPSRSFPCSGVLPTTPLPGPAAGLTQAVGGGQGDGAPLAALPDPHAWLPLFLHNTSREDPWKGQAPLRAQGSLVSWPFNPSKKMGSLRADVLCVFADLTEVQESTLSLQPERLSRLAGPSSLSPCLPWPWRACVQKGRAAGGLGWENGPHLLPDPGAPLG